MQACIHPCKLASIHASSVCGGLGDKRLLCAVSFQSILQVNTSTLSVQVVTPPVVYVTRSETVTTSGEQHRIDRDPMEP